MINFKITLAAVAISVTILGCTQKETKPQLHYTLTGAGDTTLVFVHGWAINSTYWQSQVNHFSDRYKVLAVDLQGHGQSPKGDTVITVEEYADDLVNLLTSLDLKNIVLIGHSMSGNINLHVYDKMRDDVVGFIGIDNLQTVGWVPTPEEAQQVSAFFSDFRNNYSVVARLVSLGSLFSPETDTLVKSLVIDDALALDSVFSVATLVSTTQQGEAERRILSEFKVPLLLIVAEGTMKDESSLQKYCGNGYRVWEYQGAGHYPMIEIPAKFNDLLEEAIESVHTTPR